MIAYYPPKYRYQRPVHLGQDVPPAPGAGTPPAIPANPNRTPGTRPQGAGGGRLLPSWARIGLGVLLVGAGVAPFFKKGYPTLTVVAQGAAVVGGAMIAADGLGLKV